MAIGGMENGVVLGIVTRNRPSELRRCVNSFLAMAQVPVLTVLGFDDDPIGFERCPEWDRLVRMLLSPRHYYVRGKNEVYRVARQMSEEYGIDYYIQSNDDSEWIRPGFGQVAITVLEREFPDGMGMIEMFSNGHLAHYITKFKFVDEYLDGQLGDPVYTMYFSDTDMLRKIYEQGKYKAIDFTSMASQLKNRIVLHNLNAVNDNVAYEVQGAWWEKDEKIFKSRWPEDIKKKPGDEVSP